MILDIPYYRQKKEYTCAAACLRMIFMYFGTKKREGTITRALGTNKEYGTPNSNVINLARKYGFYCYVHEEVAGINQVRDFIDLKLPIIVNYQEPRENIGHFAVVVGYTSDEIVLHDPVHMGRFRLKNAEFKRRWYGDSGHKKWILVLSRRKLSLGKQYDPED